MQVVGLDAGVDTLRLLSCSRAQPPMRSSAVCWGHNGRGWLGDGTYNDTLVPIALVLPSL